MNTHNGIVYFCDMRIDIRKFKVGMMGDSLPEKKKYSHNAPLSRQSPPAPPLGVALEATVLPDKKQPGKFWYHNNWNEGIRYIGTTAYFYRSKWEANYARYLEHLKQKGFIRAWAHEPDKFYFNKVKRGLKAYIPDFKVTLANGVIEWHEVKGFLDSKAKTKLKRFAKYYPALVLKLVDEKWFKAFKKFEKGIEGWES